MDDLPDFAVVLEECAICGSQLEDGQERATRNDNPVHITCLDAMTAIAPGFEGLTIDELRELAEQVETPALYSYLATRVRIETALFDLVVEHRQKKTATDHLAGQIMVLKAKMMPLLRRLGRSWEDGEGGYARLTKPDKERVTYDNAKVDQANAAFVLAIYQLREVVANLVSDHLDPEDERDAALVEKLTGALEGVAGAHRLIAEGRKVLPPVKPTVQVK